jgi:hypothetical protein
LINILIYKLIGIVPHILSKMNLDKHRILSNPSKMNHTSTAFTPQNERYAFLSTFQLETVISHNFFSPFLILKGICTFSGVGNNVCRLLRCGKVSSRWR